MRAPKTASAVVLLNIFSLNVAHSDAFYDALKAGGKYDPATTKTVRQNTIEKDRAAQMNAVTRNNPNFIPLSQTLSTKKFSDGELKRMQDMELNDKDEAPEAKTQVPHEIPNAQVDVKTGKAEATPPPISHLGPVPQEAPNPAIKVIDSDPDEVSFPAEAAPTPKVRPAKPKPTPTFKK